MAASNSFLNGFLGGMQAVNSMIDSQTRREYYKDQKERAAKEWEWKQQEQSRKQALYDEKKQLQDTRALAYRVGQFDEKQRKAFYEESLPKVIQEEFGPYIDGEFSHFTVKKGQVIPFLKTEDGVKAATNPEGQVVGIPLDNVFDAISSDPHLRNLNARLHAETLRLGGELPKGSSGDGSGSGSGSKLTQYGKSWEEEDSKGNTIIHQVYKTKDGYVQHSFNRNTGEITRSPISVRDAETMGSLGLEDGGGKGGTETPKPGTETPLPDDKTPPVVDKPQSQGLKDTADLAKVRQAIEQTTGGDAARSNAAQVQGMGESLYNLGANAVQGLKDWGKDRSFNLYTGFSPKPGEIPKREPVAPIVEAPPKPEGPGVVELFKRGVTQPWQQGNGASFMSGVEQAAANRQQPLGSLPERPPLAATPAPASSPPTLYDKAKQGMAKSREATVETQQIKEARNREKMLARITKQARAIGKSKGKEALKQWLQENYDEATIKELTGRLFPSFVSPSKRGMA